MIRTTCPFLFANGGGGCVAPCPRDKGFEFQTTGGQPRCVYRADPTKVVNLVPISRASQRIQRNGAVPPLPTIASLKTSDPALHGQYVAEQKRVAEEVTIILANIAKEKRISDAFAALQRAENARDTAPLAYQQARTNYYTLLRGDSWKMEEQERIARAEIDPEIRMFRSSLSDVQNRKAQQQKTIDVINGLKDRVLSLKDDFKYSVDTFQRQIGKIKDQIVFDRRKREEGTNQSRWELFDRVLNYLIIAVLLFAVWKIYSMFFSKSTIPQTSAVGTPPPSLGD